MFDYYQKSVRDGANSRFRDTRSGEQRDGCRVRGGGGGAVAARPAARYMRDGRRLRAEHPPRRWCRRKRKRRAVIAFRGAHTRSGGRGAR